MPRCVQHPDEPAQACCPDCGRPLCARCSEQGGHTRCGGAGPIAALGRPGAGATDAFSVAFEAFKPHWLQLSVAVLVFFLAIVVAAVPFNVLQLVARMLPRSGGTWVPPAVGLLGMGAQYGVSGALLTGLSAMSLDALGGRAPALGRLFGFWRQGLAYLGAMTLVVGPIIGAALVLVVLNVGELAPGHPPPDPARMSAVVLPVALVGGLVGLVVVLPLTVLLTTTLAVERVGPIAALRRVASLTRARPGAVYGAGVLGMLVASAGVFVCCVGYLPSFALAHVVWAGTYVVVSGRAATGAELTPPPQDF